jgi:hypothetical protein
MNTYMCVVVRGSRYQATTSEDIADWEDLVRKLKGKAIPVTGREGP